MAEFPRYLISSILPALPVKSLLRFRCLSKPIRIEIDDDAFINAHLARSNQTNRCKLVFGSHFEDDMYSVDFEQGRIGRAIKVNNPSKRIGNLYFLGSCNGLVLVLLYGLDHDTSHRRTEISLWNPFTRRYKKLPDFPKYSCTLDLHYVSMGLGYDSATNDHKVVLILIPKQIGCMCKVLVFNLASNAWRTLEVVNCRQILNRIRDPRGKFAHGALHWLYQENEGEPWTSRIISFHLSKEKFIKVIPPIQSSNPRGFDFGLHVLRPGRLFLHEAYDDQRGPNGTVVRNIVLFEVIKNEDGFEWRKSHQFEVELNERLNLLGDLPLNLLELSKDGNKILMLPRKSAAVIWCDIEHRILDRVELRGDDHLPGPYRSSCLESIFCWESLVPPGADSEFDGVVADQ